MLKTNHFVLQIVALEKKHELSKNQPLQISAEADQKPFFDKVSLPDVAGKPEYQGHHPHRQDLLLLQVGWAVRLQPLANP